MSFWWPVIVAGLAVVLAVAVVVVRRARWWDTYAAILSDPDLSDSERREMLNTHEANYPY